MLTFSIIKSETDSDHYFYPIFIFLSILFVYTAQRTYKIHGTLPFSRFFANSYFLRKTFFIGSLFFATFGVALLTRHQIIDAHLLVTLNLCLFLSIWYVYPFFKIKLREVPFLKAPIVAAIWTIVIVFQPLSIWKSEETVQWTCLFFVFFLALAIPFDIKDMDTDPRSHFTFPQLLGKSGAKLLSISLIVLFYVLFIVQYPVSVSPIFYWSSLLIFCVFTVKLEKDSSYLHYIMIDSTMLILALGLL
jgi:hypothetical protein